MCYILCLRSIVPILSCSGWTFDSLLHVYFSYCVFILHSLLQHTFLTVRSYFLNVYSARALNWGELNLSWLTREVFKSILASLMHQDHNQCIDYQEKFWSHFLQTCFTFASPFLCNFFTSFTVLKHKKHFYWYFLFRSILFRNQYNIGDWFRRFWIWKIWHFKYPNLSIISL